MVVRAQSSFEISFFFKIHSQKNNTQRGDPFFVKETTPFPSKFFFTLFFFLQTKLKSKLGKNPGKSEESIMKKGKRTEIGSLIGLRLTNQKKPFLFLVLVVAVLLFSFAPFFLRSKLPTAVIDQSQNAKSCSFYFWIFFFLFYTTNDLVWLYEREKKTEKSVGGKRGWVGGKRGWVGGAYL